MDRAPSGDGRSAMPPMASSAAQEGAAVEKEPAADGSESEADNGPGCVQWRWQRANRPQPKSLRQRKATATNGGGSEARRRGRARSLEDAPSKTPAA